MRELEKQVRNLRQQCMYEKHGMGSPLGYGFCMPDGSWYIRGRQDLETVVACADAGNPGAALALVYYCNKGWIRAAAGTGMLTVHEARQVTGTAGYPPQGLQQSLGREENQAVAASVIPSGVTVLPQLRIGDAERDKCLDQLQEMHSRGYLSPAEAGARQDAALAAQVKPDLDILTADLPQPARTPAVKSSPAGRAVFWGVMCAAAGALSVLVIVTGAFPLLPLVVVLLLCCCGGVGEHAGRAGEKGDTEP